MKEIQIYRGVSRKGVCRRGVIWTIAPIVEMVALVSDEDADLASDEWRLDGQGYAERSVGAGVHEKLHKVVAARIGLAIGAGQLVDHKNQVKLDCQRGNLRIVGWSLQMQNRPKRSGTSKFKGVYKHGAKWSSKFGRNYLGSFDSEEAANKAYETAVLGANK